MLKSRTSVTTYHRTRSAELSWKVERTQQNKRIHDTEMYVEVCQFRDNINRLDDQMDECDYIFSQHFINSVENNLITNILEACDDIPANPVQNYDYMIET
ncbi:MAG TPA: hypothetical protein PLB07_09790 [Bacteroidales bacterium]|nr:hypothetical protein [Bacteroidales bacterium]HOT17928.1 hypothetical protein [Bacteroidales bacterium]HQJ13102.1 hypothetical protein [Bacteroidales bacterium]